MPLGRSRPHLRRTFPDRPRRDSLRGGQIRGISPGEQPHRDIKRSDMCRGNSSGGTDESRGQPRGSQNDGHTGVYSGWNRVGKKETYTRVLELQNQDKGKQVTRTEDRDKELQRIRSQIAAGRVDYIPTGSLQIREPVLVPNSGMIDQSISVVEKMKKRRSPESRARYREKRRLRRLKEMEGCAVSETEGFEFETDDGGSHSLGRDLFLPPVEGVGKVGSLKWWIARVLRFIATYLICWRMRIPLGLSGLWLWSLMMGPQMLRSFTRPRWRRGLGMELPVVGARLWRSPVMGIADLRLKAR